MGNVKKSDRVQDTDIKRLNHMGLGLKAIADHLGCHPATVTLRLKALGIRPTDTRRSFMEQVFLDLSQEQQEWLSHNLYNADIDIRKFVTDLIKEAFDRAPTEPAPIPAPMPEMQTVDTEPVAAPAVTELLTPAPEETLEVAVTPALTDLVNPVIEPEYVADTLPTPVCGACHEAPVEQEGELCSPCRSVPTTKTTSIFG